ncbi:MAG: hypothetical protein AUG49_20825 [Catenulispora sp. 13_1_20CM_3_70_7]|nr:MAG: hypothetical protein AUG49_20825 [Catenulispora sp. 13_1_20CM_3_70_7]
MEGAGYRGVGLVRFEGLGSFGGRWFRRFRWFLRTERDERLARRLRSAGQRVRVLQVIQLGIRPRTGMPRRRRGRTRIRIRRHMAYLPAP